MQAHDAGGEGGGHAHGWGLKAGLSEGLTCYTAALWRPFLLRLPSSLPAPVCPAHTKQGVDAGPKRKQGSETGGRGVRGGDRNLQAQRMASRG